MAGWTPYLVTFKLLTPMHIGWRKTGSLQQTRPYVTGRVLWGALTAALVQNARGNDYKNKGKEADEQLAFTYFYPSTKKDIVICYPWDDLDEFSWKFLSSYVSTALQYGRCTEDGSLHETEFIASTTRDDEPVYLIGYIFERDGCDLKWKEVLNRLQFGGERGYGWGRVGLYTQPQKVNKVFELTLKSESINDRPVLIIPKDNVLLAHTLANNLNCNGIIEPLVGRETDTKTANFGKFCSTAQICWAPATKVNEEISVQIENKGLWRRL